MEEVGHIKSIVCGINNCFAVKRWPEPTQWATIIREKLRMDTVQFSLDLVDMAMPDNVLKKKTAAIRQACSNAGIRIQSVFTGLNAYQSNLLLAPDADERKYWLDWYKKATVFTAELDCAQLGGHVGAFSVADYEDASRKNEILHSYAEEIYELSTYAQNVGIGILLLEPMPVHREMTATIDEVGDFLHLTQKASCLPVRLCLDSGHQCAWDNNIEMRKFSTWIEKFSSETTMIHLQQNNGLSDQHLPFTSDTHRNGVIRAEEILAHFTAEFYPDLILEIIPAHEACDEAVLKDLIKSAEYWHEAIDRTY